MPPPLSLQAVRGRTITLDAPLHCIVPLVPSQTEPLAEVEAIGVAARLVGCELYSWHGRLAPPYLAALEPDLRT